MEQYFSRFFYSLDLREQCEKNKKITLTRMYILCYFCKKKVAIFKMPSIAQTVWKFRKFSLTEKILCEINSLVTYLVKPLLSRNFCQKSVRERISEISTLHTVLAFNKIFRQTNEKSLFFFCTILLCKNASFEKK